VDCNFHKYKNGGHPADLAQVKCISTKASASVPDQSSYKLYLFLGIAFKGLKSFSSFKNIQGGFPFMCSVQKTIPVGFFALKYSFDNI
jgi:hypothetical protein